MLTLLHSALPAVFALTVRLAEALRTEAEALAERRARAVEARAALLEARSTTAASHAAEVSALVSEERRARTSVVRRQGALLQSLRTIFELAPVGDDAIAIAGYIFPRNGMLQGGWAGPPKPSCAEGGLASACSHPCVCMRACVGGAGLTPEIISAGLGMACQMVQVAADHLNVSLPYALLFGGAESRISPVQGAACMAWDAPVIAYEVAMRRPLFLDDALANLEAFREGLGWFNEAVVHLAASQGLAVAVEDGCATLSNLHRILQPATKPASGAAPVLLDLPQLTPPLAWLPGTAVHREYDLHDVDMLSDLGESDEDEDDDAQDGRSRGGDGGDMDADDWHVVPVDRDNLLFERAPRSAAMADTMDPLASALALGRSTQPRHGSLAGRQAAGGGSDSDAVVPESTGSGPASPPSQSLTDSSVLGRVGSALRRSIFGSFS